MTRSTATSCGIVISALLAGWHPATAQHRGGGHPAAGGHPGGVHHGGQMPHGGGQVPAHLQQQMRQQEQMLIHQQQQMMRQQQEQMKRMQQQAHRQYREHLGQFDRWLEAHGHSGTGGAASRLPPDPAAFDRWAAAQKKNKARGKSYDPLYDHFRSFADSAGPNKARSSAHAREKAHAPARREEKTHAGARHGDARDRRPLAQDQAKVNLLRTLHAKLGEADHDYDGHRVEAMRSVGQALHHLGSSAPAGPGGGSGPGGLPQSRSDGILREALWKLENLRGQLGGAGGDPPHHARARASVEQAIHHLEVALRVR